MARYFLLASLVVVAASCRGGGGDLTDREITDAELVAMVLPQDELGADFEQFAYFQEESGFQSNDSEIEDAFDQEDEADDLERFGRVNGYGESYFSPEAEETGEGTYLVSTNVALYEDADGASGNFTDVVADAKRDVGETDEGVTLEEADDYEVDRIADDAAGLRSRLTFDEGGELHGTVVGFRRGRLTGSVGIVSFDDDAMQAQAEELARKLDERVVAVLEGEIEPQGTPTREPSPTEEPGTGGGAVPSDVLETFRYAFEVAIETEGGGFTLATEGGFAAPDAFTCSLSGSFGGIRYTEELVVVGEDAWLDVGDGYQATSLDDPDVEADLDLCPASEVFWEDFVDFIDGEFEGVAETRNGVTSTRYAVGEAAQTLETLGFLLADLEGITIDVFDVWLADDGGWPVAVDVDMTADAQAQAEAFGGSFEAEAGQQARVLMRVDITDVNDPAIQVEPPVP